MYMSVKNCFMTPVKYFVEKNRKSAPVIITEISSGTLKSVKCKIKRNFETFSVEILEIFFARIKMYKKKRNSIQYRERGETCVLNFRNKFVYVRVLGNDVHMYVRLHFDFLLRKKVFLSAFL